jgi:predicted dinucleotide-binding enzyme
MFLCGDDPQANRVVAGLAKDLGFDAVDAGGLRMARLLEPLAMLWINLAYAQGMGPDIAFRLMTR